MRIGLNRCLAVGALVVLIGWAVYRDTPAQAQGRSQAVERLDLSRLLCDLAQTMDWPTNEILAIAMVKCSDAEAELVRNTLNSAPEKKWGGLLVTNYPTMIRPDELDALPEWGMLALSYRLGARFADSYIRKAGERRFLTVGDGFQEFTGMIYISQNRGLYYSPRKLRDKGFEVPQGLFERYQNSGLTVQATGR